MRKIDLRKWSFIPGPLADPPESSLNLRDLVEYPPEIIVVAFRAIPGLVVLNRGQPSWWDWSGRWQDDGDMIEIGMSLFETAPVSWGGSPLSGECDAAKILSFWETIRSRCSAVWMHNDNCEIHTPTSFRALLSD